MADCTMVAAFLVTERVDELVAFYRDVLGLRVIRHQPGDSAWFDTGACKLVVHRPEPPGPDRDWVPDEGVLLWLQPREGAAALAETLSRAGVEILRPPNAANTFFFRDPRGRLIGVHEPA